MEPSNLPSVEALTAAYLFTLGKTQEQISAALSVSQPHISRLLRSVKDRYIRVQKQFIWDHYAESKRQEIESRAFPRQLGEKILKFAQRHEQKAPIVHSVEIPESGESSDVVEAFAKGASAIIKELLLATRGTVGVTWGNTVWHVTQALLSMPLPRPWRSHEPVQVVPLCGDTVIDSLGHYADRTSSRIASDLSNLMNGPEVRPAWLGLVPAFIPRGFPEARSRKRPGSEKGSTTRTVAQRAASREEEEKRIIWGMINRVPQYARIFGPAQAPLADDLHMILTASGSPRSLVNISRGLLALTGSEADALSANILGDVGGVIIPRSFSAAVERPDPESIPIVREVAHRWTGLRMTHLQKCAAQAFLGGDLRGGRPGVTLLSFGSDRVGIVLEVVKRGLVNHLIISSGLELAIEKTLDGVRSLHPVCAPDVATG